MLDLFGFLIVLGVLVYSVFKYLIRNESTSKHETRSGPSDDVDVVKGYEIHVTPDIRTRLKVLDLRGREFKTKEEADSLDFEMHEAISMAKTKSWSELGIDFEEAEPGDVWTDIGHMKGNKLESYYLFLEKFRETIEDESLSPPEKVKRIRNMPDTRGFLSKLKKNYGSRFPKSLIVSELTNIDGISESIALELFDRGIYDKEGLKSLDDKELLKIKGIGPARVDKIKSQLQ